MVLSCCLTVINFTGARGRVLVSPGRSMIRIPREWVYRYVAFVAATEGIAVKRKH